MVRASSDDGNSGAVAPPVGRISGVGGSYSGNANMMAHATADGRTQDNAAHSVSRKRAPGGPLLGNAASLARGMADVVIPENDH
jgi:hypothetical protein